MENGQTSKCEEKVALAIKSSFDCFEAVSNLRTLSFPTERILRSLFFYAAKNSFYDSVVEKTFCRLHHIGFVKKSDTETVVVRLLEENDPSILESANFVRTLSFLVLNCTVGFRECLSGFTLNSAEKDSSKWRFLSDLLQSLVSKTEEDSLVTSEFRAFLLPQVFCFNEELFDELVYQTCNST